MTEEIEKLEADIMAQIARLNELRAKSEGRKVEDYVFRTLEGEVRLSELFAGQDKLLVIHNMGQACRYCTLWADGFNGLLPHLESAMSVVLASKDDPGTQRDFARSRGWAFRLVSHGGGDYMREQSVMEGAGNMPGAVVYERRGDDILRLNSCVFGPGDIYCAMWPLLGLAGLAEWTPQFRYWHPPETLEDGGENRLD